jgi:nitrate reductase NapE component
LWAGLAVSTFLTIVLGVFPNLLIDIVGVAAAAL